MLTISSATPHYRAAAAAEFQARKFPQGSYQHEFWLHVSLRATARGRAVERSYHEQAAAKDERRSGYGWAGIFM